MKHEIFIGLNDKDEHKQLLSTNAVKLAIAKALQDCTIFDCTGVYRGEVENSLQIIVYSDDADLIAFARWACREFNQYEILVDGVSVIHPAINQ